MDYSMAGDLYNQNSDLFSFMNMMNNNKGMFGLPVGIESLLGNFAGGALTGIAGLVAGDTKAEKNAQSVFNLAQNRLGQNVLDPDQYLADYMRASQERIANTGERLNAKFGLDSGTAQGALFKDMESSLAQFMLQARQRNDQLKSQNDNMLLSLMGQVGQYA